MNRIIDFARPNRIYHSRLRHHFASHLEDWPAVLKSLRLVGDDVRARTSSPTRRRDLSTAGQSSRCDAKWCRSRLWYILLGRAKSMMRFIYDFSSANFFTFFGGVMAALAGNCLD